MSIMKPVRVEKESKEFLELLALIAYKYGEITGGRAVELLGKSREEIDKMARARCGSICAVCENDCKSMWKGKI